MATEITGFGIDLSNLVTFSRGLKRSQPRLYREFRAALIESGASVADRAKSIASQHSVSIPPTIKMRAYGIAVYVEAGNADVPLAGLYEVGNAKHGARYVRGGTGSFRHPVFGNMDSWVDQTGYPFLRRALNEERPIVIERVRFAVETATRSVSRTRH